MGEIVIHGVPGSPYVRKVLLTCLEKGAPHRALATSERFGPMPPIEKATTIASGNAEMRSLTSASVAR